MARARYEVIGINGPYDQRRIDSEALLRDAKACAQAVLKHGVTFPYPEGHRTFQSVQVFTITRTRGRLVAKYGETPWATA